MKTEWLRSLPPNLAANTHLTKGAAGKVAVLGGCAEYTGAPFYAAIAALKTGADLAHVFCQDDAATPIKAYSPELIVHGYLHASPDVDPDAVQRQASAVSRWFPALSALVVGPGLGRDETLRAVATEVLERALDGGLPCVIDADGLRLVQDRPKLVRGHPWALLTPNAVEFGRLSAALELPEPGGASISADERQQEVVRLAAALEGPAVLRKGEHDIISDGKSALSVDEPGSLKRSGGQGDVLAGSLATFLGWSRAEPSRLPAGAPAPPLMAAYAASYLTRRASAAAFCSHRRAMTAPDVLHAIGPAFAEVFE